MRSIGDCTRIVGKTLLLPGTGLKRCRRLGEVVVGGDGEVADEKDVRQK